MTFIASSTQFALASTSDEKAWTNTDIRQWSKAHGGGNYNQISRSVFSYPHLYIKPKNGGQLTYFERHILEQHKLVDPTQKCPSCKVGMIKGLDHNAFSFRQHLTLIELLELLDITEHHFNLSSIVLMTQGRHKRELTSLQSQQLQKWLQVEGDKIKETHDKKRGMKGKLVKLLHELHFYQTLIPSSHDEIPYDYTLLLGGSIQQMQMRFVTMVATFDNYNMLDSYNRKSTRNLGKIVTLTCDRVVNSGSQKNSEIEIDPDYETVWFEVKDGMVDVSEHERSRVSDLTEDTAYKAIVYAVKRMCSDVDFFESHRKSRQGFHLEGHLPEKGVINYLYQFTDYNFELSDAFLDASCRFLEHYPEPVTLLTPELPSGAVDKSRPTTKQTVKEWVDVNKPCSDQDECRVLTVSSQPNARYQQLAVLQGIEDTLLKNQTTKVQVSLTALGASDQIPTDEALDNLSRALYMILVRPVR